MLWKETRRLKQRISRLLCEATLGFDGDASNLERERKGIREYLLKYFRDFKSDCPTNVLAQYNIFRFLVRDAKLDLEILSDDIQTSHPNANSQVGVLLRKLQEIDFDVPPPVSEQTKDAFQNQGELLMIWADSLPGGTLHERNFQV